MTEAPPIFRVYFEFANDNQDPASKTGVLYLTKTALSAILALALGGVPEWTIGAALKADGSKATEVRILPPPPRPNASAR